MNKESLEILKNIEIICFLNKDKVKDYQNYLLNKLKSFENIQGLITLLTNFWFKKPIEMYNYSKLLYNEDNSLILENKYLDRFYFTNNVAESIHHKLNLCLQKRKKTCLDFIESVRNCFTNDETKIGAIERYDIKSRTLISIIQCENLKKNFKWINMNEYKEYLKIINT